MTERIDQTPAFRIRNALLTITRCWSHMLPTVPHAITTGTIGSHATESKPPVSAHILDVRAETLGTLARWASVIHTNKNLTTPLPDNDPYVLCTVLSLHADYLAGHPSHETATAQLETQARDCRNIAEPHDPLKFAGVCDICNGDLLGDGRTARCKQCRQVVDAATQQEKVKAAVKDRLLTQAEIVTLSPQLGHRLAPVVVHRWVQRGLLVSRGVKDGRPTYSAADVCDQIEQRYGPQEGAA